MKLQDQVCSLELSKRIKELGIKQKSLFYWCKSIRNGNILMYVKDTLNTKIMKYSEDNISAICSAFTASEILEMLPDEVYNGSYLYQLKIEKEYGNTYKVFYEEGLYPRNKILHSENNDLLQNSSTKMLIHLIEKNLMEIK